MNSLLKQERTNRNWSRSKVETLTGIPQRSLENWEEMGIYPRNDNIKALCRLYGKSPKELGFGKSSDIMGSTITVYAPQEEENPMSDLIRREVFSNLGLRLSGLVDLWPRRNYHYEELQTEINKVIFDHHVLVQADSLAEITRREALKSLALVPVQLIGGVAIIGAGKQQKTDTDLLLKQLAVGITVCWYLRRGKDLAFVSDLTSFYISILQPLINSKSEAHHKASAKLLAQCFGLKSKLANALADDDQAIAYEEEAIRYARLAESSTDLAIANREMALLYWRRKRYGQALPYAQSAYGLARSNKALSKIIRSFTASGLAFCQAYSDHTDDAKQSLKEAHDFFDPAMLTPLIPYNEAVLSAVDAYVHQCIGNFKEAIDIYQQYLTSSDISPLGLIENNIDYTKAEVSRDDQPRDMGLCITLLTEAITGARELSSKRYIHEARETYDMLRLVWPREQAIKTLGRDHFGRV